MAEERGTDLEPGAERAAGVEPTGRGYRRGALMAGLSGALIAAAVLIPSMLYLNREEGPTPTEISAYLSEETPAVESRSEEILGLLVNYDSETIEGVVDGMLAISTGNFREQYEEIVSRGLGDALSEASASSQGSILEGPQVTFTTSSRAVALASVEQTTTSSRNPEGRTFTYLMRLTLLRDDGEWKADRIEILTGEAV